MRLELIKKVGPYRICWDGQQYLVIDSIGFRYGDRHYENSDAAIAYAKHLVRAEAAQRRELQSWDGK